MDFPVGGSTFDEFKNFVKMDDGAGAQDHKRNLPFAAGCTQGDMIVVEPWCGIADETVADDADATVCAIVKEGIRVVSREIATGAAFTAVGQEVWFNPVTQEYTDTEDGGLYLVGYVDEVTDSDGCFAFEKRRYVEVGVGT